MSIGIFTDKNHQPDDTEINEMIGPVLPLWQQLVKYICDNYSVQKDFKYLYGQKYGWGLRFRISGKLLTSLYPTRNGFTVQIILNPAAIERALVKNLGKNVQRVIAKAHPYPEGRWLFIPVKSENDIQDIQYLLKLRSEKKHLNKKKPV